MLGNSVAPTGPDASTACRDHNRDNDSVNIANTVATPVTPTTRRSQWRNPDNWWVPGALLLGVFVGLVMPQNSSNKGPVLYSYLSNVVGWTYFCAWSVSFYPQVVLNHSRRSVIGLSLDFQLLNMMGFACYFAFNVLLYCNPHVRHEYHQKYGGLPPVKLNDVVFSAHALLLTLVTLFQIAIYYDYPRLPKNDRILRMVVVGSLTAVVVVAAGVAVFIVENHETQLSWLMYLSLLSQTKIVISVCKYCPQVYMNYSRKSTDGWNIYNVLLDFIGGFLSVAQLLLDAWVGGDWSAVRGDPVKLMLGNCAIVFDIIFMMQHYCFYRKAKPEARRPLVNLDIEEPSFPSTPSGSPYHAHVDRPSTGGT